MATSISQIQATLKNHRNELRERFRVKELAVFGSYARNEQSPTSDLDLLVEFSDPVGIEFIDLANYLEELLGMKVDVVSRGGIKPKYLQAISRDLIYV